MPGESHLKIPGTLWVVPHKLLQANGQQRTVAFNTTRVLQAQLGSPAASSALAGYRTPTSLLAVWWRHIHKLHPHSRTAKALR